MSSYDTLVKMVMLGGPCTGKSELLNRFRGLKIRDTEFHSRCDRLCHIPPEVEDMYSPTIGVEFATKNIDVTLPSGCTSSKVKLQVWDTAGQERFRAITAAYFRGAKAMLICYDVTNRQSMVDAVKWYNEALGYLSGSYFGGFVLVGLKADPAGAPPVRQWIGEDGAAVDSSAVSGRQVTSLEGELLARSMNAAAFFEVSSKYSTIEEINDVFTACAQQGFNEGSITYNPVVPPSISYAGRCAVGSVRIPRPNVSCQPDSRGNTAPNQVVLDPQPLTKEMRRIVKTLGDAKPAPSTSTQSGTVPRQVTVDRQMASSLHREAMVCK